MNGAASRPSPATASVQLSLPCEPAAGHAHLLLVLAGQPEVPSSTSHTPVPAIQPSRSCDMLLANTVTATMAASNATCQGRCGRHVHAPLASAPPVALLKLLSSAAPLLQSTSHSSSMSSGSLPAPSSSPAAASPPPCWCLYLRGANTGSRLTPASSHHKPGTGKRPAAILCGCKFRDILRQLQSPQGAYASAPTKCSRHSFPAPASAPHPSTCQVLASHCTRLAAVCYYKYLGTTPAAKGTPLRTRAQRSHKETSAHSGQGLIPCRLSLPQRGHPDYFF